MITTTTTNNHRLHMRKRKSAISSFLSLFLLLGVIYNATKKKWRFTKTPVCFHLFCSFLKNFFRTKKTLDFYSERELSSIYNKIIKWCDDREQHTQYSFSLARLLPSLFLSRACCSIVVFLVSSHPLWWWESFDERIALVFLIQSISFSDDRSFENSIADILSLISYAYYM